MELLKENERSANKAAAKVMRITILGFAGIRSGSDTGHTGYFRY